MSTNIAYDLSSVARTPAGISAVFTPREGGETVCLLLSGEFWTPLGYQTGDTLTEEELESVREAELLSRAVSRTVKILAGSDHSRSQLLRKLKMFEFEDDVAARAADYAEEHHYIDEDRQALRAAEYFVRHKFWGRKRIAAELLMRGYQKTAIRHATDNVPEEMYMAALHALLDRKYAASAAPESREDRERLFSSLYRLGYSLSEINSAVKELEREHEE